MDGRFDRHDTPRIEASVTQYRINAPVLGLHAGTVVDERRLDHIDPRRLAAHIASGLVAPVDDVEPTEEVAADGLS